MGERKGTNFYYPPDYDPEVGGLNKFMGTHALRERAKKIGLGIIIIRFELPFNIWCNGCGNHIGMGVRFNAEKKRDGQYLSTPIWKFRMKCHLCDNHFEIKTDPKTSDYLVVSGARRQENLWDPTENEQIVPEERETKMRLDADAMFKLDHDYGDKKHATDLRTTLTRLTRKRDKLWQDDFAANSLLRKRFREERKEMKRREERARESMRFNKKPASSRVHGVMDQQWSAFDQKLSVFEQKPRDVKSSTKSLLSGLIRRRIPATCVKSEPDHKCGVSTTLTSTDISEISPIKSSLRGMIGRNLPTPYIMTLTAEETHTQGSKNIDTKKNIPETCVKCDPVDKYECDETTTLTSTDKSEISPIKSSLSGMIRKNISTPCIKTEPVDSYECGKDTMLTSTVKSETSPTKHSLSGLVGKSVPVTHVKSEPIDTYECGERKVLTSTDNSGTSLAAGETHAQESEELSNEGIDNKMGIPAIHIKSEPVDNYWSTPHTSPDNSQTLLKTEESLAGSSKDNFYVDVTPNIKSTSSPILLKVPLTLVSTDYSCSSSGSSFQSRHSQGSSPELMKRDLVTNASLVSAEYNCSSSDESAL